MATTSTSAAITTVESVFTGPERSALAGFLAGYTGLTREAYALDLRQFTSWCQQRQIRLFQVRRADIECFARDLEARGRARATITRRLCTVAGFINTRWRRSSSITPRPRMSAGPGWTMSRTPPGWTVTSSARCWSLPGSARPAEHALISLLALNELRVSEATGASIEALGVERGHRTLVVARKGGKVVTVPLAPRTAWAIDLAIGERSEGPVLLAARWAAAGPARRLLGSNTRSWRWTASSRSRAGPSGGDVVLVPKWVTP
jgi:integrase/recombinase XerD